MTYERLVWSLYSSPYFRFPPDVFRPFPMFSKPLTVYSGNRVCFGHFRISVVLILGLLHTNILFVQTTKMFLSILLTGWCYRLSAPLSLLFRFLKVYESRRPRYYKLRFSHFVNYCRAIIHNSRTVGCLNKHIKICKWTE